jgi:UDP-N-acetylglucosamine--N-acetylmuramyl-(pentapeptide) pyrophosphoryl-undecaprenol N-acetylglucosamine transferase
MYYMGPPAGYAEVFTEHGIAVRPILAGKLRRYFSLANIFDVPKFFIGFFQALWKLYWLMPDVIFSKGGAGAFPVVVAGWWYRIPVAIHESDAKPGLNNFFSARFAKRVCVSFEEAAAYFSARKVVVTGTPVRDELLQNPIASAAAKEALGFSSSHPLLLVLGGSQGSAPLNTFVLENLKAIMELAQVLHQTGPANFAEVQKFSQAALIDASYENRYVPMSYLDDATMRLALSAADVALSRAGSGISELAAFGKPMILVPHAAGSANDHQRANAYAFAETGAALVIEENNLSRGIFFAELKKLLADNDLRAKMGAAARNRFVANAADVIAVEVLKLAA